MKFKELIKTVLLEASKYDVLVNKVGLNEKDSKTLSEICGPLAVWMFNKILENSIRLMQERPNLRAMSGLNGYEGKNLKEQLMNYFNDRHNGLMDAADGRGNIVSIMDYIRVGLGGNIKDIKDLPFIQISNSSREWHDSLGTDNGSIDYVENGEIVLDFRKDGIGFYWVNLGINSCTFEKSRMGHCGNSSGILYSLRSYSQIPNTKFTINKSHLTASIKDNAILQLKGPRNSKPKSEYHKYIIPFILMDGINKFGFEYDSEHDFKLQDLTPEEIKYVYEKKPILFSGRLEQRLLSNLGLIDKISTKYDFTLHISVKDMEDYLSSDYRRDIYSNILMGDSYELWDNYQYVEWGNHIDDIDQENEQLIRNMLANQKIDISDMDLYEAISETESDDIIGAIKSAVNDAEGDDYVNTLYKKLKSSLEEYGDVITLDDTGAEIHVDLSNLLKDVEIDEQELNEMFDNCNDDPSCVFSELKGNRYIDRPLFDIDDRFYPDMDVTHFNELLRDRLNDI